MAKKSFQLRKGAAQDATQVIQNAQRATRQDASVRPVIVPNNVGARVEPFWPTEPEPTVLVAPKYPKIDNDADFPIVGLKPSDVAISHEKIKALLKGDAAKTATAELNVAQSALDIQIGGAHYKNYAIQPIEYCMANKLDACQANIVKYVTRFREKSGIQDLEKAKHYIDLLIEHESKQRKT